MSSAGRRALLGAALAAAALRPARAQLRFGLAHGADGWLFPVWEDVRRVELRRTRQVGAAIAQAAAVLKRAGIEPVLTLAPTRARLYADKLPPEFQPGPETERRYAVALEEMRRGGALVPDLAALLAALRRSQPEPVFFKADSHWTGIAAEAAAEETARLMQAGLALPRSERRGTRLGNPEPREQQNDLIGALPAPEQAKYPPERFRARQVLATSGRAALLEGEAGDVAIVGNSYMQPLLGFPPMLSHRLDRPVSLFWKTARFGPWRTMLDYLASPLFAQARPRALVWHFMEGSMEKPSEDAGWWGQNAMPQQQFLAELRRAVGG